MHGFKPYRNKVYFYGEVHSKGKNRNACFTNLAMQYSHHWYSKNWW